MSTPTYSHYRLGQLVRFTGTFVNIDGENQDPDTVMFAFRGPSDTDATEYTHPADAELVKDGIGIYHVDLDLHTVGTWHYRFYSTGTGQAAEESRVIVQQSNFD